MLFLLCFVMMEAKHQSLVKSSFRSCAANKAPTSIARDRSNSGLDANYAVSAAGKTMDPYFPEHKEPATRSTTIATPLPGDEPEESP